MYVATNWRALNVNGLTTLNRLAVCLEIKSEGLLDCDNAGHGVMNLAVGATQQDTVDHPGKIDLPSECNLPNCHPSGNPLAGISSSTNGCRSTCSNETSTDQFHGCSNVSSMWAILWKELQLI